MILYEIMPQLKSIFDKVTVVTPGNLPVMDNIDYDIVRVVLINTDIGYHMKIETVRAVKVDERYKFNVREANLIATAMHCVLTIPREYMYSEIIINY